MAQHNELGKKGERLAKRFLIEKGYKILATNYRFKHLEVDIIAQQGEELIVVEVKTRQNEYLAGPEVTVTKSKQKAIVKVANAYVVENDIDLEIRFDIVSIILNDNETKIEHLEDAFYPTL
ncbi:MAG TPA: endonuclease [Crocinitomix sp.]|nr:endonuclease [Crocinitomix sp.]